MVNNIAFSIIKPCDICYQHAEYGSLQLKTCVLMCKKNSHCYHM